MEKRNIQISLEEAREWYNSGDSFKRELALKTYKKEELVRVTYGQIMTAINYNKLIINFGICWNYKQKRASHWLVLFLYVNAIYDVILNNVE